MTQTEFKKFVAEILDTISSGNPEVDFPTEDWVLALQKRLDVWEDYMQ